MAKKAATEYPQYLYVRIRKDVNSSKFEVGTPDDVAAGPVTQVARYKLVGTGVVNVDAPYYVEGVDASA